MLFFFTSLGERRTSTASVGSLEHATRERATMRALLRPVLESGAPRSFSRRIPPQMSGICSCMEEEEEVGGEG